MFDWGHLPSADPGDVQIFPGRPFSAGGAELQPWIKPRGVKMIHIFMLGPGGNGAAGAVGPSAAGGAGGASGSQSTLLIPAALVPNVLYVGTGYQTNPPASYVSVLPYQGGAFVPHASNVLLIAPSGTTPGSAATAQLSGRGIAVFLAGQAGGAGGTAAPTAGTDVAAATTGLVVTGGAGGGGMSAAAATAGGKVTSTFTTRLPFRAGGVAGSSGVDGAAGNDGFSLLDHMYFIGGAGGGSGYPQTTTSNGGKGGAGGYGCGGGGGGGAVTGKTAGLGGAGGQGLIIITCW